MEDGNGSQAVLWCRWCSQPARSAGSGDGAPGQAVHAGTGEELCADGEHAATPVAVNPELTAIAERVMEDFPGWEITVHFGFLFRAAPPGSLTPVHVEATAEGELRAGIARQRRTWELSAQEAEPREAAR